MSQVVFIKLKEGIPAPPGYTEVRTMRGVKIYQKVIPQITSQEIDDLNNLFNNMGVNSSENVAIVPQMYEDAFLSSLEKMSIGGKKHRKSRKNKAKRSKKSKKMN
jgi:hypothetical protein